jgi:hypothetical protein
MMVSWLLSLNIERSCKTTILARGFKSNQDSGFEPACFCRIFNFVLMGGSDARRYSRGEI